MPDEDNAPASESSAHQGRAKGQSRRRWPRRLAIGVAAVVVFATAAAGSEYWYVRHELNSVKRFAKKETSHLAKPAPPGKPENILLVGSDSRGCIGKSAYSEEGNPDVQTGQRSDTIIVVRLVPATDSAEMLSIPRDTVVPIPGTGGSSKINSAFNSGPNLLIETIEDDFHIPINHVVVANFCGFTDIVNALGGIYLKFPDKARDLETGLRIHSTGCQLVTGVEALQLVRSRYYEYYSDGVWNDDGMSDWSRIRRQQAFFHAVLDRVHSESLNVLRMNSLLIAIVKDVTVDQGFTSSDMLSLALRYRHFSSSELRTLVLPTAEGYIDGVDGIAPAAPQAGETLAGFLSFGAPRALPDTTTTTTTTKGVSSTTTTTTTTTTATAQPAVPTTTSPPDEVVLDTPQTLNEPWNPVPCSP
ncbi:MAG: LCP family protein [Acidimicrobiales bacterium]